jgi:hypothetical protein
LNLWVLKKEGEGYRQELKRKFLTVLLAKLKYGRSFTFSPNWAFYFFLTLK